MRLLYGMRKRQALDRSPPHTRPARVSYKQPAGGPTVDASPLKEAAGRAAADLVRDGMVVGLGTGSTVRHTILELARRVREEGLDLLGVPTSVASEKLARDGGIRLTDLDRHPDVDLTIDGADEFDADLRLIKGGGGALTREKIVAAASRRMVAVCDPSKQVERLGSTFALPVEVVDLGKTPVRRLLESLGAEVKLRRRDGDVYRTDNGHPILDARWPAIEDPEGLEARLQVQPGVVETGLFLDLCDAVYVARETGVEVVSKGVEVPPT